eukprot:jgi/Ulvmu1/9710/UM055_0048.1
MWPLLLLLLGFSLSTAQPTDVTSVQQLQQAVERGDTHIVIRSHLDVRGANSTCPKLCQIAQETVLNVTASTASIRGECRTAPQEFVQDVQPPLDPVPDPVPEGHCLIITDKVVFTIWGEGLAEARQLWLDCLFVRMHRLPGPSSAEVPNQQMAALPTSSLRVSAATVWLTNFTLQGDLGPQQAILALTRAHLRITDSRFMDLTAPSGSVVDASSNSTLILEDSVLARCAATVDHGVITLGQAVNQETQSDGVMHNVTSDRVLPAGQPRLAVARNSAGIFYTDTGEYVYNLDTSDAQPSRPLHEAPLDGGRFAAGPEAGSRFDVLWRDARELEPAPVPLSAAPPLAAVAELPMPTPAPAVAQRPAARPGAGGNAAGRAAAPAAAAAPPPAQPADSGSGGLSVGVIVAIAVGSVAALALLGALAVCWLVRVRRGSQKSAVEGKPVAAPVNGSASGSAQAGRAPSHFQDSAERLAQPSTVSVADTTITGGRFDPAAWPEADHDTTGSAVDLSGSAPPAKGAAPAESGVAGSALQQGSAHSGGLDWSSAPTQAPATVTEYARRSLAPLPPALGGGEPGSAMDQLEDALDELAERKLAFLGCYLLASNIDRRSGGQGVVQFARTEAGAEQVAIKFYSHHEAFKREAELYANPAFKELMPATLAIEGNADGRERLRDYVFPPCIVIEKGQSLNEWAHTYRCDFVTIFQALSHSVRALASLHSMGYAHRDIKPGNILRRPKQHDWTLIDFGCAARIDTPTKVSFSLVYAAPETVHAVEAGERTILAHGAVDIWAVGVIAFELLTGERTFPYAAARNDILAAIAGRSPLPWEDGAPRAAALRARMRGLKRTVLQCLRRDPAARPTAAELLASWDHLFDSIQTRSGEALPSDASGMSGRSAATGATGGSSSTAAITGGNTGVSAGAAGAEGGSSGAAVRPGVNPLQPL